MAKETTPNDTPAKAEKNTSIVEPAIITSESDSTEKASDHPMAGKIFGAGTMASYVQVTDPEKAEDFTSIGLFNSKGKPGALKYLNDEIARLTKEANEVKDDTGKRVGLMQQISDLQIQVQSVQTY